jgi:hypothetical protein
VTFSPNLPYALAFAQVPWFCGGRRSNPKQDKIPILLQWDLLADLLSWWFWMWLWGRNL